MITPFERSLAEALPRPEIDPQFSNRLLMKILSERPVLSLLPPDNGHRNRMHQIGGMVGAVALAVTAAIGWKVRGRGGKAA